MKYFFVRPLCLFFTLFFAQRFCFSEPVSWEKIESFFDFSTITGGAQQNSLKMNVELLIKQQLGLKSGQNLWEAFLYLQKVFEGKFSFKFTFDLNKESGAGITLDKYDVSQKMFYFKITCNEMFSNQAYSAQEILGKNVLCRPCLIRFNGRYHLRKQELPFFITLAHELLHALNQLERILYIATQMPKEHLEQICQCESDVTDRIEEILPIQVFLMQKLRISSSNLCLQGKYKKLWQNDNADDSLNEMTVILYSLRGTEKSFVYIGETTFLREHYKDPTIVSWSHNTADDYTFYRDGMNILLESEYVEAVLGVFNIDPSKLLSISKNDEGGNVDLHEGLRTAFKDLNSEVEKKLREKREKIEMIRLKRRGSKIFQFISFPALKCPDKVGDRDIKLLPFFSSAKTTLAISGYRIIDVPADGNCAFTAVKVALGDEKFRDKIGPKLTSDPIKALRNLTADEMEKVEKIKVDRPDFIQMLRQPGFWNNGIDGAVGIEVLSFVAQVINQSILLITQEFDGNYHYWISGTAENPCDGNLALLPIQGGDNIENILNNRPDAIKLFHNGIHFQAIIEQGALPPPPQPSHS